MVKLGKLDRAKQLEARYEARDYKGKLSVLSPYIKYARLAESSKDLGTSKHLLLASHLAMLDITKGESDASLFSKDFKKLCEGIAYGLQPNLEEGAHELFANWIQASLVTALGSLFLSIEKATPKDDEYPVSMTLYTELWLRLMLKTEAPSIYIDNFVEALGITPKDKGVKAIETLSLLFILSAISSDEINEEIFRAVRERILKNLESIDSWVEYPQLKTFVKLALNAIENQKIEIFTKGVKDLLNAFSINIEHLKEDFQTIRRLFTNLQTQFAVKRKGKDAFITFTG